jgi:hypothetical protein
MDERKFDEAIDLGAWLGRKQAFSGMAGRCSAADAHCLRSMKDEQKYKTFGLTWDEFCSRRLGISRSLADKTIRLFEEFGETYFYLTGLIPIAPEDYRRIAGSVTADGLRHGGETIAIVPQNAPKLAAAVQDLKRQTQLALPAPGKPPKTAMCQAAGRLQSAVGELEQLLADDPGNHDRAALMVLLVGAAERLCRLHCNLRQ